MRSLYQDLRFGLRVLLGSPAFTAVAILTLALGIAANTTVFGWIEAVLLRPVPGVRDAQQLAALEMLHRNGDSINISYAEYRDYRDHLRLLSGLAVHTFALFRVGDADNAQATWGELVSGNYFDLLGVRPLLGRLFLPEEFGDSPGAYPVAVISERLWRRRFQSDPAIAGKTVRVNRTPLTIVGVAPAEFRGAMPGVAFDMWVPLTMRPQLDGSDPVAILRDRGARGYLMIARLQPGVTLAQARAEADAQSRRLAAIYPRGNEGVSASLVPLWKAHSGAQGILLAPLRILMALSLLVLLIACANVANLLLARSVARQNEFSIRLAMGAGRGRIARQLLTEALLLAALGTLIALPLTYWLRGSLLWMLPPVSLPVAIDLKLDAGILAFSILICTAAAVLSGLAPVLHAVRADVNETLKEGGRGGSSGARSHRMHGLLVASEVALALVALIGAGLFVKSFRSARTAPPGFDPSRVAVCRFYLSGSGYSDEQGKQFCLRLRERLQSSPGIADAVYALMLPLGIGSGPWSTVDVEGYIPHRADNMNVFLNAVAPGYFSLLRIPQIEGRDFTERDGRDAPPVMIVNETFARRFFAGAHPIGRKVRYGRRWATVIGLVRDAKYFNLAEAPMPYFYVPFRQMNLSGLGTSVGFYARSARDSSHALAALRREAAAIDPGVGMFEASPLAEYMVSSLYPQKVAASLLSVLGALSLVLAAVGLYSVMAYAVSRRTHEIGIRMALGAQTRDVVRMVLAKGMVLAGAGLLAGLAAALAATRLAAGLLLQVSATDPPIFAGAALFLLAVALVASYLPARRATRVDPLAALRHE